MVRLMRFELIHPKALPPQDSVSTNSTIVAKEIKKGQEIKSPDLRSLSIYSLIDYPKNGFAYKAIIAITNA